MEKVCKNGLIFIKPNAVSTFLIPGANTSPFVLDAVLERLRNEYPTANIIVGDTDSSARNQLEKGIKLWGYDIVVKKYDIRFLNLLDEEWIEKQIPGLYIKSIFIPKIVVEADSIISIPVINTHTWSKVSCALKNQYGLTLKDRHKYHVSLDEAIVDINLACKPSFCLLDGTIGLEAGGPVMGRSKICNIIIASNDIVSADVIAIKYMGFENIKYIRLAEEIGLGNASSIDLVGDEFIPNHFIEPVQNLNSIWHKRLRMLPFGDLLFNTAIFRLLSWASTFYQIYWFYRYGKKCSKNVLKYVSCDIRNRGSIYFPF